MTGRLQLTALKIETPHVQNGQFLTARVSFEGSGNVQMTADLLMRVHVEGRIMEAVLQRKVFHKGRVSPHETEKLFSMFLLVESPTFKEPHVRIEYFLRVGATGFWGSRGELYESLDIPSASVEGPGPQQWISHFRERFWEKRGYLSFQTHMFVWIPLVGLTTAISLPLTSWVIQKHFPDPNPWLYHDTPDPGVWAFLPGIPIFLGWLYLFGRWTLWKDMRFWQRKADWKLPGLQVLFDAAQQSLVLRGERENEVKRLNLRCELVCTGHPRSATLLYQREVSDLAETPVQLPDHLPRSLKLRSYRLTQNSGFPYLSRSIEVVWTVQVVLQPPGGPEEVHTREIFVLPYSLESRHLGILWLMRTDVFLIHDL